MGRGWYVLKFKVTAAFVEQQIGFLLKAIAWHQDKRLR